MPEAPTGSSLPSARIDADYLDRAGPQVRVVSNYAVGVNNIDLDAAAARGVVVTNTPDVLTRATAELGIGLMLALLRRIAEGDRFVRRRAEWEFSLEFQLGSSLDGKELLVVGPGRIGRETARLAEAFGAHTSFAGRGDDLRGLLGHADVVSLHVPLTDATRHLIDERALAAMRPSAVLVNVARGPVVDERALVAALLSGTIAGAALDVYEHEPAVEPGLLELENVVLTPTLAARRATRGSRWACSAWRRLSGVARGAQARECGRLTWAAVDGYGSASMWGELRRVLVRRPLPEDAPAWETFGWRAAPRVAAAQAEHEAFCAVLADAGAEVVVSEHEPETRTRSTPTTRPWSGATATVLLHPGKEGRRHEPEATVSVLERARVPVVGRVEPPATVEGGDTVWLDERTLLVGIGYRTTRRPRTPFAPVPRRRGDRLRPAPLERGRRGDAPDDVHLAARPRPRARVSAHRAHAADVAARGARDRGGRGARRGVRVDGTERARARPQARARTGGERRDGGEWSARASMSSPIAATRSRARATAARPASRGRCGSRSAAANASVPFGRGSAGTWLRAWHAPPHSSSSVSCRVAVGRRRRLRRAGAHQGGRGAPVEAACGSAILAGSSIGVGGVVDRERIEVGVAQLRRDRAGRGPSRRRWAATSSAIRRSSA